MSKDPQQAQQSGNDTRSRAGDKHDKGADDAPMIIGSSLEIRPLRDVAAEAILDKLNRGIVIFDGTRQVRFTNQSAIRLLGGTKAIATVDGQLTFSEPAAQPRLDSFLHRCRELESSQQTSSQCATVMRVDAGQGCPPYRVLLSTLHSRSASADAHGEPCFLLMIYEPSAGRHVSKRILTDLYNLSDAEAALTLLLFAGESLATAADQLHVSINTANTHLQHIFLKCEVHSQGERVQLLSLGPRTL